MGTDSGSKSMMFFSQRLLRSCPEKRKMIYMKLITNFIAGSLLTGILALAPATSFARGGGGGGGHFGGFRGGPGAGAWHHDGGWAHHAYSGYYGYYGPFDYDLDGYAGPYYDDSDPADLQPASTGAAPDEPTSLIMSVQKELARLGYYHGQIDGMTGSETGQALRWFQSAEKLPVSGQIDSATVKALRIG
jgi:Putative peptidoglycan binding domain